MQTRMFTGKCSYLVEHSINILTRAKGLVHRLALKINIMINPGINPFH